MRFAAALFAISIFVSHTALARAQERNPWLGQQRAAVLLIEWADQPAKHSPSEVDEVFFKPNSPSMHQFFLENSAGKFELTGAVSEWRKSPVRWQNWSANQQCNPTNIINAAWEQFGRDTDISKFDSNGDGKIDHLFVVHSGRIQFDRVGPDCMFGNFNKAEHVAVFQLEGTGPEGKALPIGFYLHEAGHQLFNFPDLYGDHYHGKYGIGMWGIMGLGAWGMSNELPNELLFRFPSHFEPKSKAAIGWINPVVINRSFRSVKLRPIELTGEVMAIPIGKNSYYFLEYRSKNGFSSAHPGHGLLIWKDYKIIQADGRDDINHGNNLGKRPLPPNKENFGDDSDPFPGSLNVREYVDNENGVRISNITQTDSEITFDVVIGNRR